MPFHIFNTRIAIIGGGKFCRTLLSFLFGGRVKKIEPKVLAVADINKDAVGLKYAETLGIHTTTDYTELFDIKDLETLIEITYDYEISEKIKKKKPQNVRFIDHFEARSLWDFMQVELAKEEAFKEIRKSDSSRQQIEAHFKEFAEQLLAILERRHRRSKEIELDLYEHERTLFQIIQGSTIPTFVIDADHTVTHWNLAMERLTGIPANQAVGTRRQWAPFYKSARPTMADVILDQIDEGEIKKLYGTKWRKSALIEGAYEAEDFFPALGDEGKWCWFTAAPITAPDGTRIGAIETVWDKTDDRRVEQEKEKRTRELSALCSIYTALSAPWSIDERVKAALKETRRFLNADFICIYLLRQDGEFHLQFNTGDLNGFCRQEEIAKEVDMVFKHLENQKIAVFDETMIAEHNELKSLGDSDIRSVVYIPISAKEEKLTGIIRMGSRRKNNFKFADPTVLELIGNRIGVTIENALLQEQYIRSEEKYRSLFNNDPSPIFILDRSSFQILDTNKRAEACYGYLRSELIGMPFLKLGNEEDVKEALGMLSRKGSILLPKKKHYKKDGSPFFVNINMSIAKYGQTDVIIASTTDISESVEKETQLIQASKMTTLGVMAAGMAHEINQPLNVIQICADYFIKMIERGEDIPGNELKMMAIDIDQNVQRISNVIKHVRDFSRQSEVIRTKVDINDPIRDIFKVLGHQLKVHGIDLVLELEEDLPPIMAEHNRLEQVFINLVTNAIDAMDEKAAQQGRVKKILTIRSYYQDQRVFVSVKDTGIGMSESVRQKLFEPFFTTKKAGKGTGLGTSISYSIIKDFDGSIDVRSKIGEGTEFIISFPAHGL